MVLHSHAPAISADCAQSSDEACLRVGFFDVRTIIIDL
jgi:hypothetical protein